MGLSQAASDYMDDLTTRYVAAGFPRRWEWRFDAGREGPTFQELEAYGILELTGTEGSPWALTEQGLELVMQHHSERSERSDRSAYARAVFRLFEDAFEKNDGVSDQWWFPRFDDEDYERVGLTERQFAIGLKLLERKNLVETQALEGNWALTDGGVEVCLHPQLLDEALGPRTSAVVVETNTTYNIDGPTQIGNNNTMSVTYAQVLQQLIEEIDRSKELEPEQKAEWKEVLGRIAESTVGAVGVAAALKALGLG